jgi:hypothetical protein
MRAKLVEYPGELVGDISRARDQDAFGNGVQMKRLVAGDAMLVARDIWAPAASRLSRSGYISR